MKKSLQKIFFAVVCICAIFACSKTKTEEIVWVKSKNVTVAWDAPTSFEDGTPIPRDVALRYCVYIDKDTDSTHKDMICLFATPIDVTNHTIDSSLIPKGKYFIGIQTLAYEVKYGGINEGPEISRIAWSSNKADTQSGAFGIWIK